MLAEGHKNIAAGWDMFEEAVGVAGTGDLPQLLRGLKEMITPTPPLMPVDVIEAAAPVMIHKPVPSPIVIKEELQTDVLTDDPLVIMVEGKRKWSCPQCHIIKGSKNGCDTHTRQVHTRKAFVCSMCSYSSYNLDCMHRHEKEYN